MNLIKTNVNPKEWKHEGDCVVRALAQATGKNWIQVYDELYEIGRKKCRMPNSQKVYEEWLKQNGFNKQPQPRKNNGKKYTVREFADEIPRTEHYMNKWIVVSMANHLSVVHNGDLYDTWNCGSKSVGNYWIK